MAEPKPSIPLSLLSKDDNDPAHPTSQPDDSPLTEGEEDIHGGFSFVIIMLGVLLSVFLVALDRTIVATAVPKIADEFHSLFDIGWYASSYLLTSCSTQLLWGKVFGIYSTKSCFLTTLLIFAVGSALCGGAPNSKAFIVGRAIAGIGAAGIMSGASVIITRVAPLTKRPTYVGLMGSMFGIASVVGPLMGGAFTDKVTWRWCFYINLPIAGLALAVFTFLLHLSHQPPKNPITRQIIHLDPLGSFLFIPGIVSFLLALEWGGTTYPWNDAKIIALFVLSGVLMILFILVQFWQQDDATIAPRIFLQRSIYCGWLFIICVGGALITVLYTLPLWFQGVKGTSAIQSGIDTIPMVLSLVVGAIISGRTIERTGYYVPWMFVSTVLLSVASGLMLTLNRSTGHSAWIGYQVIFGLGLGTGLPEASLAAQTVLKQKDVSVGIALMLFGQSLGGSVFVAVSQALYTNYITTTLPSVPGIDVPLLLSAGAEGLQSVVPADKLTQVVIIYNEGLRHAFTVAVAVSCLLVLPAVGMEWIDIRKAGVSPKGAV